ncbi:MAG: cyclopropane fatty acyl phospholipid synthase [Desulforhopalus sp.]|nr:cyclopropane fatty acyl phospholipid synthase [Desulforhopalus sp.]
MKKSELKKTACELLESASIKVGGSNPWDIQVHNEGFYARVLAKGSLGLGESYMEGWWECEKLDEFFFRILSQGLDRAVIPFSDSLKIFKARIINMGSRSKAFDVGRKHYDIGNRIYRQMLDKLMIYSCGYWKNAADLNEAQENKLDLICRKLKLKPGMKLLDIGCGWGGTARYAAEKYGVSVEGVTVSEQQAKLAKELCEGLPVNIHLQDYRSITGVYDRIVSVGMMEHVGVKNYATYFKVAREHLTRDGLFLLHTIGSNTSKISLDPWIERYIFTNSMLPSGKQILNASEDRFIVENWHNFGADYDRTLLCWYGNFKAGWGDLKEYYDDTFYRMWEYYLLACAGCFRARKIQLWQIVFSPHGVPGGYVVPY